MGACLSAPKPATDGPSVSARSARTFGVAPVQTEKSDVESSGEMVEVPLDTPPAATSGAGKGSGFGSFLQAKVTVDPGSAEDANGAAHRVLGALVPERGRIDQALVDDMDAAVASALEGSDDKAAEPGLSADRVASAEAEAAAAREQDVSLVLSDDPSDEETFSDSGEDDEEEDDDSDEYETDAASSAEEDEGEDAHRSGSTEDATGEAIEDVTEDVTEEATEEVTDDAPAIAPATAPAADASDDAPTAVPGTPEQTRADAFEDDFEDSLSVVDMGPVSDSEASGSEFDSAASDGDGDGDEDAPGTEPETATSAGVSASTDGSADATVSDILDEDALGDRDTDLGSAGAREPRPAVPEETDGGRRPETPGSESSYDDSDSESSYDSESSSAYGDEGDRFDADAGPRVASTVETFGSTVDATVTEVRARSKHSPPPTPRVRGAADPESLGATPRSARSGGDSNRSGADSHRVFGRPDSNRSGVSSEFSEGWTSVVVLYVTSVSAVRRTAGRCQRVRQTLANLGVEFLERDVSMATAYKDELARRIRAATGTTTNGGKEKTRADDANDDDDDDDGFGKDAFGKERDRGKKPSPPGKPPTSSGSSSGSGTNSELVVPCLFVDDAFVGSGEALDVSAGDGSLRALLEERGRVGRARAEKDACVSCAGRKLVVCDRCDGSMRWRVAD